MAGFAEAKRVHDVAQAAGIPVWCGGMLEAGIGRAHNIALVDAAELRPARRRLGEQALLGARHHSSREWRRRQRGTIEVRDEPGFGYEIDHDWIRELTVREETHCCLSGPSFVRIYTLVALMTTLWSLNYIVAKYALREFPALLASGMRMIIAGAIMIAVYRWNRSKGSIPPWTRRDVGLLAFLGVIGVGLNQFFFVLGISMTTVSHAAIVAGLTPVTVSDAGIGDGNGAAGRCASRRNVYCACRRVHAADVIFAIRRCDTLWAISSSIWRPSPSRCLQSAASRKHRGWAALW